MLRKGDAARCQPYGAEFPAATISFNLASEILGDAVNTIETAERGISLPAQRVKTVFRAPRPPFVPRWRVPSC